MTLDYDGNAVKAARTRGVGLLLQEELGMTLAWASARGPLSQVGVDRMRFAALFFPCA